MDYKIEVNWKGKDEQIWFDQEIQSTSPSLVANINREIQFHLPKVVALPDLIDFHRDDYSSLNYYNAITNLFPDCKIIKKPDDDFFDYKFDSNVIY